MARKMKRGWEVRGEVKRVVGKRSLVRVFNPVLGQLDLGRGTAMRMRGLLKYQLSSPSSKDDTIVDAVSLAMEAPRMDARDVLVMCDDDVRDVMTLNPTIDIESNFVPFFDRLIQRQTDRQMETRGIEWVGG